PDLGVDDLVRRMDKPRGSQSLATFLRKTTKLAPVAIGLLREATLGWAQGLSAMTAPQLAALIKAVPVRLTSPSPIARAISTAGGIAWPEIDKEFMLQRRPGVFVAGEMLDWEAPTGGYLLQACFASSGAAGRGALAWIAA